jgi:general nucleoside transport system permease protein
VTDPLTDSDAELLVADEDAEGIRPTPVARMAAYIRGGGVIVPLLTVLIAFIVGGLVVLITGGNPFTTYWSILKGTGIFWLLPWVHGSARAAYASNLQQTLLLTTPLILTGLAVAFAFRGGMFNIGGQGQYIVGTIVGVWVGSSFAGMPAFFHVLLAVVLAALAGAAWAGIAGLLKATTGANEVISTIMLNWIAIWIGVWLFQLGGPLQDPTSPSIPQSSTVTSTGKLPVFWGNPALQGLSIGIFIALAMAVVFWLLLNRSTTGYETRAVGFNPDAAEASGMSVKVNYVRVMAISGMFAGLAGAMDVLGWEFHVATNDIQLSTIGFLGIAVALLGRSTAAGTVGAALLFGGLTVGTSDRNANLSNPTLTSTLTLLIQGLVILLVSTDVIALAVLRGRRRTAQSATAPPPEPAATPPPVEEQAA